MAYPKTDDFKNEELKIAEFAKALAHPARVAIVKILARQACICGEIVDVLPLSQSTVSQHLKELKSAEIIEGESKGTTICYKLNKKKWQEYSKKLEQLNIKVMNSVECC